MSVSKVIFLTGAPSAGRLDWHEDSLLDDFGSPLKRFLGQQHQQQQLNTDIDSSDIGSTLSLPPPRWRKLLINGDEKFDNASTQYRNQQALLKHDASSDEGDFAFLEHSFAQLDRLDATQIAPGTILEDNGGDSTFISLASLSSSGSFNSELDTSFDNTATILDDSTMISQTSAATMPPPSIPITDLKSLPTAQTLLELHPQTPTVNLLVGIISISQIRTVQLRRAAPRKSSTGPPTMDLLETLVGDETRAGFKITFWISPESKQQQQPSRKQATTDAKNNQAAKHNSSDDLRSILTARRPGELVMLRNVALAAFRDVVYGQSLNRRFAKNSTEISVLAEKEKDGKGEKGERSGGFEGLIGRKWKRVAEWRDDFVGRPALPGREGDFGLGGGGGSKGRAVGLEDRRGDLPPDTQD